MNVVCFRYLNPDLEEPDLEETNRRIVVELQEQGIAVVSGTVINGKYALHVAHRNHGTRREGFEVLVREVIRLGGELAQGVEPSSPLL